MTSDPIQCGDEPLLIKQQTEVPVVVAKKRTKAIEFLINKYHWMLLSVMMAFSTILWVVILKLL